ncbi:MAG TPA: GNAT family N-acetyltransferase [Parapedobacter sp.]|nr:GNAT family N-acetyltransferase [Parapedobacter sp.]
MFLSIRLYQPADRESVIRLDQLALSDLSVTGLPRQFDDLKEIETRYLPNGAFIVAEIDELIVGMGAIRYIDQDTARINRMRVDPFHRRKGIARAVLNWLEHQAENAGRSRILLNTLATLEKAQQLYESHDYVKIGEGEPDGFRVFMYEKRFGVRT